MQTFGAHSMVQPLRHVVISRPNGAMTAADPALWHYAGPLDGANRQRASIGVSAGSLHVLGGVYVLSSVRLWRTPDAVTAHASFRWSITYITLLFAAMAVDVTLAGGTPTL